MHSKQIVVKDILLNYYVHQVDEKLPNLVFLHGWGSNSTYWFKSFNNDLLKNYNIYCLDLPGFAKSQAPKSDLDVSGYGEFVKEFINKLDLKKVILVGHSLGGRITIKLAAEGFDKIYKIVLVNSAGIYHTKKSTQLISKLAGVISPIFKPHFMQGIRKSIYKLLKSEDYLTSPALQKTFVNVVQEDLEPYLSKITYPTLIIWGDNDKNEYTPVKDGEKMHSIIKNSTFKILDGAGHYSFLDKPQEFINELINFIK